jgi:hypothetical protein
MLADDLRLRSAVPGRVRWEVAGLRNRPWRAATVEMALRHTPGILAVEATPLTGRLLVRYDAGLSMQEITRMVYAALYAPPLTSEGDAADWLWGGICRL